MLVAFVCFTGTAAAQEAVVFVLDSPINEDFLAGRVLGLRADDITHGSLVGRVIHSYCRAPLKSIPVEDVEGRADRSRYLDGLREALDYARTHTDVHVIVNVSLGSPNPSQEEERLVTALGDEGALVVAAAGNDDSNKLTYPAAYDGVIAVASAGPRGKAPSSNYGPQIDVAASGDISFMDYEFLPYEWLRREMEARGTSFAAPRVAATLAFLLDHAPRLSGQDALRIVLDTARPIDDRYFEGGMLGAGLLDVRRAKSAVARWYGFANFVLPVCVWVILGVLSAYLCLTRGMVGAFLSLMLWILVFPASFFLLVQMGRWLQYAGGGSLVVGLGGGGILSAAAVLALLAQRWHVAKTGLVAMIPCGLFALLAGASGTDGMGTLRVAAAAGAAMVGGALLWEWRTRAGLRKLASLRAEGGARPLRRLLRAGRRTLDRRVLRLVLGKLAYADSPEAVEFLLRQRSYDETTVGAMAAIAARSVDAILPSLLMLRRLDRDGRERLLLALRRAHNPDFLPHLETMLRQFQPPSLQETVRALREDVENGGRS